jgi:Flp pilus assembly protein TadG
MLKKFLRDTSGNFSLLLGLSAITLASVAGMAVDLSNQMRIKTSLQDSVDAATIAGAALAYDGKPAGVVKQAVKDVFKSQCPIADCDPGRLSITLYATKIEVESIGSSPTFFMGLVGKTALDVTAKARVNLGGTTEHIEVHMVLDNTGSMNIVDGLTAINQIKPLFLPYDKYGINEQCAFACHLAIDGSNADVTYNGKTGAQIARDNGIPMREDRIHSEMIDQARRLLTGGSNIKVGVYSFTWGVTKMIDPSSNYGRVRNAINDVTNLSEGTQYEHMAPEADIQIGASGTGSSPGSPKKIIVLITDGVHQRLPDHKAGLMPTAMCDKLKEDGRELYVLNIAYPDPDIIGGDRRPGGSPAQVKAFYNDIEPRLKSCASSEDTYFRADYGVSIDNALKRITDRILIGGSGNLYLSL